MARLVVLPSHGSFPRCPLSPAPDSHPQFGLRTYSDIKDSLSCLFFALFLIRVIGPKGAACLAFLLPHGRLHFLKTWSLPLPARL